MATDRPRLIAHRGFAAEFPENTVEAVRGAIAYADAIELDVRQCGSGELVIVHDAYLGDFLSNRAIDQLSYPTLAAAEPPIPTLKEVLSVAPDDFPLILELKDATAVETLCTLLNHTNQHILISSPDRGVLTRVNQHLRDVQTSLLHVPPPFERMYWKLTQINPIAQMGRYDTDRLISEAQQASCDELHVRYELCVNTDIVRQAHSAGLSIAAWTVNSAATYRVLQDLGVDGIITDTWRVPASSVS